MIKSSNNFEILRDTGPKVLDLCAAIKLCIDGAENMFKGHCRIYPFLSERELLIEQKFDDVAFELISSLDHLCREYDELIIKLETSKDGKNAVLYICDENREIILKNEYLLFHGTPGSIVREPEIQTDFVKVVEDMFNICKKLNKLEG